MSDGVMNKLIVQYDRLSKLPEETLLGVKHIEVRLDESDSTSVMAELSVHEDGSFSRIERYESLKEFSTVSMKELLTLFAKRSIIASDTVFFHSDDPRLHAFLSKLSYPGIESVCNNLKIFSEQFKAGKVTLDLPRSNKHFSKQQ